MILQEGDSVAVILMLAKKKFTSKLAKVNTLRASRLY